ncbi:vWA domain-containing protein, partial [Flavobacterium aquicola]|uniref:vWA domain-containing protein n=1 Tax=Flavobacterium aquicola TaxID=1682742 RepID=UPI00147657D2
MKAKTTLFISILFLFIGNIYSQNSEDLDNLGTPVYVGNVKPFSIPSSAKTKTLKTSTQTLKSFATRQTNIEWPNPGAVHIEKTAEATTTLGKWKINVLVQGKNVPKTTDVVLVIDNSGSMVGPRITSAIAAANTFVNEILTQSIDIRVAIVTINGTAVGVPTVNQGFTDDAALLNTAISSITAHDGTNLQGGFYAARQLMNSSTASRKAVILLSDGNPTYSYSSAVTTDWLLSCGNINDFNISDIDFEENHLTVTSSNYSSVSGDGQNFGTELYSQTIRCNNNDRTFIAGHHGLPTKYEARLLIDSGVDVYTIGFEVLPGGIAEKTLSGSQNKGYFTATTSNIESVYSQIRSNIAYAATNAVFSDPMSTYIVLNSNTVPTYSTFPNSTGDVVVSKGTVSFSNNGYVLNDPDIPGSGNSSLIKWKITWNIGTVSELGDQMYYFVDMAPNITPSVLYDANEQTYMDYTDVNGNTNAHQQTPEHFTIPKVSGGKGSIEIYYYTVNEAGQPINSSGTVVPVENAVKLIPGNSKYFVFNGSTALDLNQAYTVEPESAYSSNSILYQLYCTFGNVSITPTSADPNKKVWFGYIVSTPPIAADVQYCLNKTAAPLTASLSGGHTSPNYILYYFDSLNGPAQTAITPSTAVAGQTTYYVAEGKSLTCFGEKVPITVTIYPEITVSAGTPFTKTCTANINGASIGETAVTGNTYSWTSVPVGFTSADANPTVNPDQTTVYTVVKTNSASGCTATASVTITVDNSPITVSAGNPFTKTCITNIAGASIGETAVAGNIYSWTSVPAGFTSADANPTVNPDQTTVYNVVKTNFASGCTATANVTVTVDNSPITVSAGNSFTKTCTANTAGSSIGETAVIGNTYSWTSVPAGFSSADASPIVNPDQTTVYTVVKTNSTSGCTATASVTVTVDNSPITVSTGNSFTKTCT